MKKLFIAIAALALVASAACTKVNPEEKKSDKVSFKVATYAPQTKADSHGHTSFLTELAELGIAQADAAFSSKAFVHAANGNGVVAAPAPFFAAGTNGVESVKYNAGATTDAESWWEPVHTYYWPKSANSSLSFFSWYDFSAANPTLSYTTDGGPATLKWENRTVALKDNVMWADAAYHYKSNLNPALHGLDNVKEGVPTLFHHALAKVRFKAGVTIEQKQDSKNADYYTFWKVTLSDVALADNAIKSNGNLELTQTSKTSNGVQTWATVPENSTVWAAPTATQAYLSTLDKTTVFNTDLAKGDEILSTTADFITTEKTATAGYMNDNYFTVLPQAIANGVALNFKYTIETKYGKTADGVDAATTVSTETVSVTELATAPYTAAGIQLNQMKNASNNAITNWEINHCYTYTILINPETNIIKFDPAVDVWAAEETASITVPPTNNN